MSTIESDIEKLSWAQALKVYSQPSVVIMLLLGFSAGLPFLLVFSTLTAWLSDYQVSKALIGFFGWVGITYSVKFFWSPVVDRIQLPMLGRILGQRRSWILFGQLIVVTALLAMSGADPSSQLTMIAVYAVMVAFGSSTQDIAIDAYRIEILEQRYQGAMAAAYVFGYRLALLVAGAGSLYIADWYSWSVAYQVMAGCMLIGVVTVMIARRPSGEKTPEPLIDRGSSLSKTAQLKNWLDQFVVQPFADFFRRYGRFAVTILLFIGIYRLSDIAMGVMANPFYLDLGFSKSEIASVAKLFGFVMTIAGAGFCGVLVAKYGVHKPLLLGAVLVASTNLIFCLLAETGYNLNLLIIAISADNLSAGIASTAFLAYLAGLTNTSYTATQYALFSSLMTLPGKFFSGFSGVLVDAYGYTEFFLIAAALGLPAIILSAYLLKRQL
ncbi:AmpG family muropeptide MFS transporter [Sinobacterium norvegicum]|uniref:AmpG family muropeptide MFS transporter n=1 Tax=Sinobacterium norvegicum TaxID=1641715 RepID=UPI0033907003